LNSQELKHQFDLLIDRGLNHYLNKNLDSFKAKFEKLKELQLQEPNDENFNIAFNLFYKIFDFVPLMYHELETPHIYRSQPNEIGELFNTQRRISYNKDNIKLIKPGKFNAWYEPMFYGSLPYSPKDKKDFISPSLTAALESYKDFNDASKTIYFKDLTIGKWKISKKFTCVNLCFDNIHLNYNHEMKETCDVFLSSLSKYYSPDSHEFIKNIFSYYSSLCRISSNEGAYYLLTAFFTAIRHYYAKFADIQINGIISSSAATNGRGLNIVLTPSVVDKHLILDSVRMLRFFLVLPEARTYSIYKCSETVNNSFQLPDFNFSFNSYLKPAERFLERIKQS
jgi:hypothetical protein